MIKIESKLSNCFDYEQNLSKHVFNSNIALTLKEPGGAGSESPFDIFAMPAVIFFALKFFDFFPSSLAIDLRQFL